jgi:hypothetical protein
VPVAIGITIAWLLNIAPFAGRNLDRNKKERDMFGSKAKKIRELEYKLAERDSKLHSLRHDLDVNEKNLELIKKRLDSTPEDCTPGRWCNACAFSKCVHMYSPYHNDFELVYLCGREQSCKNFIQREVEE